MIHTREKLGHHTAGLVGSPPAVRGPDPRSAPRQPLAGLVALVGGLLIWEGAALLAPNPPNLLPAPDVVVARLWDLAASGVLWHHLSVTLTEAALGFALAAVTGLALGYPVAKSPLLEALLTPYIAATQAIPVVAIAPLMVLWFGLDLLPKVLTCAIIVFFPILVNTVIGLRAVDRALVEAAQICGAGRWQLLRYVEAPLALRTILGGLKLGLTLAITGAVVGEFIAADAGLGYLLTYGRSIYDTPLVFAALGTLAAVAVAGYSLVSLLETRWVDWE
ncbi:MAG TPA: ABC transporter permease [Chloroflexia bacterium]|nr:ABC transporter permease [Chloroflexia bacterium]